MQPVDTNRPGFQPLGCGSIWTQGFALGWYRSAPLALEAIRRVWILALEAIRRVWIFGERHKLFGPLAGRRGCLRAFGIHLGLDSLPDVVAGLVSGLEEEAGLVCDVLEIAHEGGAVLAGLEVLSKIGILGDTVSAGREEVGELLLKLGAGQGGAGLGVVGHFAVSLRAAGWLDSSGWRSNSRSLSRALCSWDLLLPVEHSSMVAISLCSKPSTSWRTKTMR